MIYDKKAANETDQEVSQMLKLADNKYIFHTYEENKMYRTGKKKKKNTGRASKQIEYYGLRLVIYLKKIIQSKYYGENKMLERELQ